MNKINESSISKYKGIMKKSLGDRYIHPEQVSQPLFIVQNIVSYDTDTGDVLYTPYVATNTFKMYDGFLKGLPNGLITFMEALVSHADKDGFAFPSVERLSEMTGLGRSTVLSYIKAFANNSVKGKVLFYKQTIKRGKGQHDLNMYYIPACVVAFTDIEDLQTDEDKLEKIQRIESENDYFEIPDIVEDDFADEAEEAI
ncbi:helix-turn-helix domain-containing protein [Parageobacillus thermoglucosidasius]|uniref:helix-turn-helix domain-containing protein n=1 Tax=Parageobacillus thermoglucosidasius TaxID=1426 RepID=UPI0027E670ED|nr:hypothetical protein PthstB1num2_26770 [Parageobacillus thermoglucosidasius]